MSEPKRKWREKFPPLLIAAGLAAGLGAALLAWLGNPGNMGVCMACFGRDIAGAVGLHRAAPVQYLRPEIFGIILGAAAAALFGRELKARSGSSPAVRFILGFFVMIGALVFLGCPTRLVLRLAGGDGNAILGLAGFTGGIALGSLFLARGTSLGRSYAEPHRTAGLLLPLVALAGLALLLTAPKFIHFSQSGPGAMRAPLLASLGIGLLLGVLGQRSRLCFAGGIRDMILFRSPHLLSGFVAVLVGALALNAILGQFKPGFSGQPAAHTAHLWNFLGMALVGLGSALLGGCPFRQLVLAAQGNGDAAVAILGMFTGAAFAHNFGLAATPGGVSPAGMVAVGVGLAVCTGVGLLARRRLAT
ncbi:MAG: YedE family putative selenium transporter [Planctomycetota bacterium]|jgi:YedE family putative selenium metabolism protein